MVAPIERNPVSWLSEDNKIRVPVVPSQRGSHSQSQEVNAQCLIESSSLRPLGLPTYCGVPAYGVLQYAAETVPDRIAVTYGDDTWDYRELNRDAIRCMAMLQGLGVKAGDRVGILLPNVPEYIIAANAIWRAGATVVAISPLMVAEEVEAVLDKSDCRFVICLDLLSSLVSGSSQSPSGERTIALVSIRKHLPAHHQLGYLLKLGYDWLRNLGDQSRHRVVWFWDGFPDALPTTHYVPVKPRTDVAYILPTGGTTGVPKAVMLSHENLVANAWQQFVWTDRLFATETMLAVLPFFHSYAMSAVLMTGAMMAATLVLDHRYNTCRAIRLIAKHRPTVLHAVPTMLVAMNAYLRKHPQADLSSLRWVISGGATLDEATGREFAEHSGALVVEGYGLSEASPVTHVGHLFQQPQYGCIGYPLPMTDCRIFYSGDRQSVDSETELHAGQVGEICIRGPQVMLGYLDDPQTTDQVIRNGWLHTGDLGIENHDGTYSIVGRIKDLIITSGFNVYPVEVESALCAAGGVLEAAVVGVPDPDKGEIVCAYIVMKNSQKMDVSALRLHCEQHLSTHKRPRRYVECKAGLPKNFLGKVIRRKIREEGHE
jgi:long-chain acyl-CoA synthetase